MGEEVKDYKLLVSKQETVISNQKSSYSIFVLYYIGKLRPYKMGHITEDLGRFNTHSW